MRLAKGLSIAALAALTLSAAAVGRDARACGKGISYGPSGSDLLLAAGVSAVVSTNVIFTVHDAARAGVSKEHDVGWSKAETYVMVPELVIGAAFLTSAPDAIVSAAPFAVWPASMMVHGFYATNGTYGERWALPVATIGAMDAGLVGYWAIATLAGHPPSDWFGAGELITGLMQTSFGLVFAAQSSGHAARDGLLVSLVPAAMMVHGYLVVDAGDRASKARDKASTQHAFSFFPSTVVQTPTGPAPGLTVTGAF